MGGRQQNRNNICKSQGTVWKGFNLIESVNVIERFIHSKTEDCCWGRKVLVVELLKEGHTVCCLGVSPILGSQWYLSTLSLKFQKARTKIEVFLSLSDRKSSILLVAFCNFKLKVLKYPRNFTPPWYKKSENNPESANVAATSAGGYKMLAKISLLTLLLKHLPAKICFVLPSSQPPRVVAPRQSKPTGRDSERQYCLPPPLRRSRQQRPRLVSLLTSACLISLAEYGQKSWWYCAS